MSRIVCAVVFILLGSLRVYAQPVTLHFADETGEALPGVTVKLTQSGDQKISEAVLSDIDGQAVINVPAYPAQLEISYLGFNTFTKTLEAQPQAVLNVTLDKKFTDLGEVVVTGVGRPTKLDQAVSLYRIVTKDDIRAQGAVTLNDAIRNQLGLNIGNDQALGSTISMRGLSGNNVKVLIDGLPLNGREAGNIDMSQINMSNIERVEMVQGPMSIMYGSDALGGVINLITKTNQTSSTIGANAFYETVGKYNVDVNGNVAAKRHSFSLNLGRNFFQGWDPVYKDIRYPLWRPKELYFANFKYSYKISENATISYGMDLSSEKLYLKGDTAGFSYLHKNAIDQEYTTTRFINRIIATWKTGASGFWQSNNSYSIYDRERRTYITDLTTMESVQSQVLGDNTSTQFNDFVSRTTYNNKVGILNYTAGYDIGISMAKGVDKIKGGNKSIGDYAGFLTADVELFKGFKLQPAIRFTYNTSYKAPLIPSLAFLYKAGNKATFRGSYALGFRAPSLKELYLDFKDSNHDIVGNTNLKAETGNHFQLSGGYNFLSEGKHNITTSLTGFYDDVKNQISLAQGDTLMLPPGSIPPYTYVNIGKSRFFTLQWRNDIQWDNTDLVFGGSYNKNIATTSIDENGVVSITPDFHYFEINAQLNYKIPKLNAGFGVFYKYTGSQPTLNNDVTGGAVYGAKTKSYHNIDASVNKQFWQNRIMLTVGVRNLTNNIIINYVGGPGSGGGGVHGGGSAAGLSQTPGRSGFVTLGVQLGK